jgi:hypothetical protein
MAELEDRKSALIRDLNRARAELSVHSAGVNAHFNPGAKIQAGFVRHRFAWMGAAGLFGLVLSKLGTGPKMITVNKKGEKQAAKAGMAGLFLGILKIGFDLFRPMLTKWATKRVSALATGQRPTRSFVNGPARL